MQTPKVASIPRIQQKPRQAADTAIHYGYCAYKDISLASSLGLDHKVQPADSPYYRSIPCRQLIPFTNIEITEVNESAAATTSINRALPIHKIPKSAKECAEEMEQSYAEWGFRVLRDLTGYSEEDSFAVFETVQPFVYKLKDILDELEIYAPQRIEQTEAYEVEYEGVTAILQPLREDLKEVALKVQQELLVSARQGLTLAEDSQSKTEQSMSNFFAGGQGKRVADPHDRYLFQELGVDIPTNTRRQTSAPVSHPSESAESIELRRRELELKEREIALREMELGLRAKPQAKCAGVTAKNEPCKNNATDGAFCASHAN